MAQHDFVIDNSTGQNVRIDINDVLKAILTNNSGTTDPATVIAGAAGSKAFSFWADTNSSPAVLKIRNAADNAWIELFQLDGTLTLEDGSVSSPALAFRDDLNTGVYSSAADTFNVATAGVERMELGAATVFNEDGADVDFRIEGDTDANLFYVDAGNSRIGIGISTPQAPFQIFAATNDNLLFGGNINASDGGAIRSMNSDGSAYKAFELLSAETRIGGQNSIRLSTGGSGGSSEAVRVDSSGNVGIGSSNPQSSMHLKSQSGVLSVDSYPQLTIETAATDGAAHKGGGILFLNHNGSGGTFGGSIQCLKENSSNNNESNYMRFSTRVDNGSVTERVRISAGGQFRAGPEASSDRTAFAHQLSSESGSSNCLSLQNPNNGDGAQVRLGFFARNTNNAATEFARIHMEATETQANSSQCGSLIFQTNKQATLAERMRLNNSGKLLIGTTSGGDASSPIRAKQGVAIDSSYTDFLHGCYEAQVTINSGGADKNIALLNGWDGGIHGVSLAMMYDGGYSWVFGTNNDTNDRPTQRATLRKDGQFIVGAHDSIGGSNGGVRLQDPNNGTCRFATAGSGQITYIQFINGGSITGSISGGSSSTAYNTSSDYRLKENETAITDGITRLKQLKPYRFNWKSDSSTIVDGFFAHEVSSIVPESITGTKDAIAVEDDVNKGLAEAIGDPIYQNIDQSKLVPLLVAAVKELIGKVETLEAA
jgi:hypothetical protein